MGMQAKVAREESPLQYQVYPDLPDLACLEIAPEKNSVPGDRGYDTLPANLNIPSDVELPKNIMRLSL